ncbi:hypothetical protein AB0945_30830 [Streptomyces sp. NPDC005474]|uniref:WD40/YVTN/BNR-like repeat-containing protein n=1 Tax=Streptomyces sp. NPDC005474 TaxID=3154878 RepID=UPI003455F54C
MMSSVQRPGVDKWESVGPYASARTVECLVKPDGGSVILASGPSTPGGFWSEDSGATWQPVKPPTPYPVGTVLVGNHADPKRWWLTTTSLPGVHESGVFRSDDRGATWERLDVELMHGDSIQTIAAHRRGKVLVGVGAQGGTYVSRDGGDSWQNEDLSENLAVIKVAFLGDDLVFQTQQDQLLYIVRNAAGKPQPPKPLTLLKDGQLLSSWEAAGQTIAVVVLGTDGDGGLVVSRDAGVTWAAPRKELSGGTVLVSTSQAGDQILHQSSAATWLDSGDGFRKVEQPGETARSFCPLPEGGWLIADRVHGLYSTADWKLFNLVGVPAASVTALAVAEGTVLAGTETGLFRSSVPVAGPEWETPGGLSLDGNHIVDLDVSTENPSLVWRTRRVDQKSTIERSLDAGKSWKKGLVRPDAVYAVHIHPLDPNRVIHSFGYLKNDKEVLGVRTTDDAGVSWFEHDHGRFYIDLVADPANPDGVWMASYTNGLYYSADFGKSWESKTAEEANAVLVTTGGSGGSRVLIGGETIRYSDDRGDTFQTARMDHRDPLRVVAFAQHDGVLFAATAGIWYPGNPAVITAGQGVLRSRDNGNTWHDASGDLPGLDVRALAVDPGQPCLYAGLHGGSVHRLAL